MNSYVIAAVEDMFFASKIRGTAEGLGVKVSFPRSLDALVELAEREPPGLLIVDLHAQRYGAPADIAARLKSDERLRQVPLVGFFSHVQTELQRAALDAGFDKVMPRSAFTQRLAEVLQGNL